MKRTLYILLITFTAFNLNAQICVGTAGQLKWECWQNLYDDELGELYAEADYPNKPDYSLTVYKVQSPVNFDNLMGGRISGFLSVPVSDTVTFNITGDDKTRFYLSSDDTPDNLLLEAYADAWTNIAEHDKYPEQTSAPIFLQAGQYYYFEVIYVEGGGGDHVSLYWKTDNEDPNNWVLINNNYINGVDCLPAACPDRGTACDDGDPTTSDDQEDGYCNCLGKKDNTNTCIGERYIKSYLYDSIPGSYLNDLYTHPDFPAMPFTSANLDLFAIKNQNTIDSSGTLIQAYITVPVTGDYKFNLTGNNESIFFLSSDSDPANKQAHQILVTGSTGPTEHDKYIYQSTSFITLEKDSFYYVELNHKDGSWNEHFSIFWQTPFTADEVWKRVPDIYFYNYECTLACIPQGTPCDDGDPFTNNDVYDANCECIGTPCTGPDCNDPLASYTPYPKCDLTDQVDNRADNNWLSCALENNPNSNRPLTHWIQYDFGQKFIMHGSHIWNYNESGFTDQGFTNVAIDYSLDGVNWTELITQNWPLANGSSDYSGFTGPDFGGVEARYVLITCLDTSPTPACRGFGKILINADYCADFNMPCDDGNPATFNDVYDEDCVCVGTGNMFNDCVIDTLTLGDTLLVMDTLTAINLLSSESTVSGNDWVLFVSGNEIDLQPGFETVLGSNFEALIEQCATSGAQEEEEDIAAPVTKSNGQEIDVLKVFAVPETDIQYIQFYLDVPAHVRLDITDKSGKVLFNFIDVEFINKGTYLKRFRTKKIEGGEYNVVYHYGDETELESLSVTN